MKQTVTRLTPEDVTALVESKNALVKENFALLERIRSLELEIVKLVREKEEECGRLNSADRP